MAPRPDDPAEEPDPLLNPDGTRKKDLRYTGHEHDNVRVDRSLDGSGHLARGDRTNMSVLNFSSRHQARTDRDPEFAFRPPPGPAAPAAAEAVPPPAGSGGPGEAGFEPEPGSLLEKIKKILGF